MLWSTTGGGVLLGLLLLLCVPPSQQCQRTSTYRSRSYTVRKPANKKPWFNSDCSSTIVRYSSSGSTGTTVSWSSSKATAYDSDSDSLSVTAASHKSNGDYFLEGETRVTYKALDSEGASDYCSFTVKVIVRYCSSVSSLQHGSRYCSGAKDNLYGSVCTSYCYRGYRMSGSRQVTCRSDRRWSSSFATCKPVSCGRPRSVQNGYVYCPWGHEYLDFCFIQCNSGYYYGGIFRLIWCNANRKWAKLYACYDLTAPTFPDGCPDNITLNSGPLASGVAVNWTDPQVSDNSGHVAELTSSIARGSVLEPGSHTVTLTAADAVGNRRSCRFYVDIKVWACPAVEIPYGSVSCSSRFTVGSQCRVTCNKGYRVQGNDTLLTCVSTDQGQVWSPSTPYCQEVVCPPPELDHASFSCKNGLSFSKTCTPTCHDGFEYKGQQFIRCSANGSWADMGYCQDVKPPSIRNCPGNIYMFAEPLGETTNVTWEIPDAIDNAGQVQLSSDYQPGSAFPIGDTTVNYTAVDETGNTENCSFKVTVTALVCDKPDFEEGKDPKRMTYSCPDGYVYGASCTLNCTHGFPLLGSREITCNKSDQENSPKASWEWPGTSLKPKCIESKCPKLESPRNGALTCHLGETAWDCLMQCQNPFEVPGSIGDGRFLCNLQAGHWRPDEVPDCSVRRRAKRAAVQSDLFYYADSCDLSLDKLRSNFITRMNSNSILKDACLNVPTCVVDNVEVFCGESRRKRSAGTEGDRSSEMGHHRLFRRQSPNSRYYVLVTFEVVIDLNETDSLSAEEVYQRCDQVRYNLRNLVVDEARKGTFDEEALHLDPEEAVGIPTMKAVCPSGNLARTRPGQFSCVGCSEGHYLTVGKDQCQRCPVGSYSDIDNATECTPCPEGQSTVSTASTNSYQCLVQCSVGHLSPDGFVPCQPCPAGQYQPGVGATSCQRCPVNTWTLNAGSSSAEDCADANIVLDNSTFSSALNSGNSVALTVLIRVGFPDKDSNVTVSIRHPYKQHDMTFSALDYLDEVKESKQRLFHRVGMVLTSPLLPLVANNLTFSVYSEQRRVIISSLAVFGEKLTREDLPSLEKNCTVNSTRNLLAWYPDPRAILMPSQCDAFDECSPSPCGDQGVCINLLGGYECRCQDNWSGVHCQTPPDPCSQHQCQNGATCLSAGEQNYTCTCPPDFVGQFCELEKVDGGWTEWQEWSQCSCGGQQQRQRRCSNPAPHNHGRPCPGHNSQLQNCSECFVDDTGVWSNWTEWSECSATCGGGQQTRNRTCERLQGTGQPVCEGSGQETAACNTDLCAVHGGWSQWSAWSQCSVTCANGTHSRERSCNKPVPAYGGNACNGSDTESETCVGPLCPECDTLPRPARSKWRCAVVSESPYLQQCNFTCLGPYVIVNPSGPYTCGHQTAFLWNHQRKVNGTIESSSPTCSRARPLSNPSYNLKLDINTDCDPSKAAQIVNGIEDNLNVNIACRQQGLCKTDVATVCKPSRKRSTPSLQIVLKASLNVNITDSDMEGNDSAWTAYQDAMTVADESLPDNDTLQNVFTVSLPGGETVTPDLSSVDSELDISCQPGTILDDMACAECPVGSMEENGSCVLCPREFYQDQPASTSCKPCPPGFSWDLPGAPSIQHCAYSLEDSSTIPPATTTFKAEEEAMDIGLLVGLVVGLFVAVILILIVVVFICYKQMGRQQQQRRRLQQDNPDSLQTEAAAKVSAMDSSSPSHTGVVPPSYEEAIEEAVALMTYTEPTQTSADKDAEAEAEDLAEKKKEEEGASVDEVTRM